jgi:hypothetical protein
MGPLSDWWYNRIGGYFGGSGAGLRNMLRYGFSPVPIEMQGLIFTVMALCLTMFFMQFSFFQEGPASFGVVIFAAQFGILMPGQLAGEMLAQRRPRMGFEMLLPVSRTQLVDALLAVSVQNAAKLWLMMHVTLGIALLITGRPVTPRVGIVFVILSAAVTFAAVGISLRLSVWSSMAKRMLVSMLSWVVLLPTLVVWVIYGEKLSVWPFVAIAVVFFAVGSWAIDLARQAWMDLEFA